MARERKHKRKAKNGGRFSALYVLISVVLIFAVIAFASIVFFRINRIEVEGNTHYTEEQVIEASGVQIGDNLMLTGSGGIVARLLKELPYLSSVSVRRSLPDALIITVSESNAKAALYDGRGSWWLIDGKGKLLEEAVRWEGGDAQEQPGAEEEEDAEGASSQLEPEPESIPMPDPPEGYPTITGLTLVDPVTGGSIRVDEEEGRSRELMRSSLLGLLPALENHELLADVTAIDLSGESEILIHYQNRLTIKLLLGMDYDYQAKLIRSVLDTYVSTTWADKDTGTLDMTFSDGNPRLTKESTQ